ncbi:MAG: trypsin-like peptidase domain-containing protein [Acidisphaera sp.]|nr:trypsin-like peptidase domain-containing protein [Acidisphaera sp.]
MPGIDPNGRDPNGRRRTRLSLVAVLLAGTALGGYAAGHAGMAADAATASAVNSGAPIAPAAPAAALPDFSALVARVTPAVVSITTKLRATPAEAEGMPLPFPFGMMGPNGMQMQRPRAIEARGSGFIINADGTVVTNNHVVKDARSVSVTLADGTQLPARVIGRDARTDLAVLKVDAGHPLAYIGLGNSADVQPGQWVIAVGNPFGLGGTVTAGIVSARGRDIGEGPYDNFIQVDAPINQGNSGGPLFTQDGKVVGVNTAILSPSGGSIGIGFAIPSDTVRTVVAQLEKSGHVTRGYLGVEAQEISPSVATALHLPSRAGNPQGALVATVQPDSPALRAGLQPGDVIQRVNGQAVANPRDLAVDIAGIQPGGQASLAVLREGNEQTVTATVASMPSEQTADLGRGSGQDEEAGRPAVGLALAPLDRQTREQLDLPAHTQGAVIAQVEPGSPADQAGLRPGDVVMGVGSKSVGSPQEAVSAIRGAASSGHEVALRVMHNGHTGFVALNVGHAAPDNSQDDSRG